MMRKNSLVLLLGMAVVFASCRKEPDASFTVDDNSVNVGDIVKFTNTSTDAYNHVWDFGDGEESIVLNPTHIYYDEGTYTVTLQVSDDNGGAIATTTSIVEVSDSLNSMIEASQEEKDEVILEMAGKWDLDQRTIFNSSTSLTDFKTYSRTEGEFMADGSIFISDDLDNKSTGFYSVINSNYIDIFFTGETSGIYRIKSLNSSSMTLEHKFTDDSFGNPYTITTTLEFRR